MSTVTLHLGDCRDWLKTIEPGSVDAVVTDPPWGMNYSSHHNTRRKGEWAKWVRDEDFAPIHGDDRPFDPSPWLEFPSVAFFGANWFSDRLPVSRGWIVWDKLGELNPAHNSDCELIWTNADKVVRVFRHLWRGLIRGGEENVAKAHKFHPHQKPVKLMLDIFAYLGLKEGMTVADPYMGSGSTGVAAVRAGLNFVGCEINPNDYANAEKRIAAERAKMSLFAGIEP